jgi:DNA-binding HxlR family transcriptional regulator
VASETKVGSVRLGKAVRGSTTGRPVMALLDLLGRRWTMRIMWELRNSAAGFRELQRRCDDMSSSMLDARLTELRAAGLADNNSGAWALTDSGQELLGALKPLYRFADRWAADLTDGAQ